MADNKIVTSDNNTYYHNPWIKAASNFKIDELNFASLYGFNPGPVTWSTSTSGTDVQISVAGGITFLTNGFYLIQSSFTILRTNTSGLNLALIRLWDQNTPETPITDGVEIIGLYANAVYKPFSPLPFYVNITDAPHAYSYQIWLDSQSSNLNGTLFPYTVALNPSYTLPPAKVEVWKLTSPGK